MTSHSDNVLETCWAVIPAGGSGERFGGGDKLLVSLLGQPVLAYSLNALASYSLIAGIVVAVPDALTEAYAERFGTERLGKPVTFVAGGPTRRESVANGLQALPDDCSVVVIHDGARSLITHAALDAVLAPVRFGHALGAVVGHPCVDTLKQIGGIPTEPHMEIPVETTVPRQLLWQVQTPQVCLRSALLLAQAHVPTNLPVTDDVQLLEIALADGVLSLQPNQSGVVVVPNAQPNIKITTPADVALAEWYLQQRAL